MTSYLKEERDYVPWYMVDTNVGYDYDQLALTEANATFEVRNGSHLTEFFLPNEDTFVLFL